MHGILLRDDTTRLSAAAEDALGNPIADMLVPPATAAGSMALRGILVFPIPSHRPFATTRSCALLPTSPGSALTPLRCCERPPGP